MNRRNQRGFSAVEAVIIVFVVLALGIAGWFVFTRMQHKQSGAPTTTEQTTDATTPATPTIQDASDLDSATKALDDTNVDATTDDSAALDAELNRF